MRKIKIIYVSDTITQRYGNFYINYIVKNLLGNVVPCEYGTTSQDEAREVCNSLINKMIDGYEQEILSA